MNQSPDQKRRAVRTCPRCKGRGYVVTFPPAYDYYSECGLCDGYGIPRDSKGRFRKIADAEAEMYGLKTVNPLVRS